MNANDQAQVGANLSDYSLRPARYCNIDGSGEIGWGTFCLCMALSSYLHILFPGGSVWTQGVGWFLFGFGALAPAVAPRFIKRSITWKRTGYVAYRRGRAFWLGITVSLVTAGALSYCLSRTMMWKTAALPLADATTHTHTATLAPARAQLVMLAVLSVLLCSAIALYFIRRAKRKNPAPESEVVESAAKPGSFRNPWSLFLYRASGGKILPAVGIVVFLMMAVIPLAIAGTVFCLAYLNDSIVHPGARSFYRIGMWTLTVASNATLYLMMAAVTIKQESWKWLLLVLMVFGSLAIELFAPENYIEASRPLLLFLGLVWIGSGSGTLLSYIRRTHIPETA